eukprot:8046748-Ditylum_brightwellii.AAC.1
MERESVCLLPWLRGRGGGREDSGEYLGKSLSIIRSNGGAMWRNNSKRSSTELQIGQGHSL